MLTPTDIALLITAVSSPLTTVACAWLAIRDQKGHQDRKKIQESLTTIEDATNGTQAVLNAALTHLADHRHTGTGPPRDHESPTSEPFYDAP